MDGDGDREAGEDEARGIIEREADALAAAEGTFDAAATAPSSGLSPISQTTKPEIRKATTEIQRGIRP